jgi:hypothetical protein
MRTVQLRPMVGKFRFVAHAQMGKDSHRRPDLDKERAAISPNVRIGDIVKGLPVPNQSCRGVYPGHVLEHLALDQFHVALEIPGSCSLLVEFSA